MLDERLKEFIYVLCHDERYSWETDDEVDDGWGAVEKPFQAEDAKEAERTGEATRGNAKRH